MSRRPCHGRYHSAASLPSCLRSIDFPRPCATRRRHELPRRALSPPPRLSFSFSFYTYIYFAPHVYSREPTTSRGRTGTTDLRFQLIFPLSPRGPTSSSSPVGRETMATAAGFKSTTDVTSRPSSSLLFNSRPKAHETENWSPPTRKHTILLCAQIFFLTAAPWRREKGLPLSATTLLYIPRGRLARIDVAHVRFITDVIIITFASGGRD